MNEDLSGMKDIRRDQMDTPRPKRTKRKHAAMPKSDSRPVRLYLDFGTPALLLEFVQSLDDDMFTAEEVSAYMADILDEQNVPTGNRYILRRKGEKPDMLQLTWEALNMDKPNNRNHKDA